MNGSGLLSQHLRTVEEDKCLCARVRERAGASACGRRGIFTLSYRTGRGLRAQGQHKREKSLAPAPPARLSHREIFTQHSQTLPASRRALNTLQQNHSRSG